MPTLIKNKRLAFNLSNASSITAIAQYDNLLAVANSNREIFVLDMTTLKAPSGLTGYKLLSTNYPTAMAFMTSTKLAIAYWASSTPSTLDLSSGTQTDLSSTVSGPLSRLNGMAGDPANSYAIYITPNNNSFVRIGTGNTSSTISPSWLSGKKLQSIIHKPGSANFIAGMSDGVIREFDTSGTSVSTISAATITSEVGSRTLIPESMALIGDNLIVGTSQGILLHYKYSTGTLLDKRLIALPRTNADATTYNALGVGFPSDNGLVPIYFGDPADAGQTVALYEANGYPLIEIDRVSSDLSFQHFGAGLNSAGNKFFCSLYTNQLSIFDCQCTGGFSENTKISDPPGLPVDGRVVRLAMFEDFQRKLESDTAIDDEETLIDYKLDGVNYMELISRGTEFSSEDTDVRIFEG